MPALRQRHDDALALEDLPASAMMTAAAAQFTPTSNPWMQVIEPTWGCVWLVVDAGVVCADARLPGRCRASGRNRSTTCYDISTKIGKRA